MNSAVPAFSAILMLAFCCTSHLPGVEAQERDSTPKKAEAQPQPAGKITTSKDKNPSTVSSKAAEETQVNPTVKSAVRGRARRKAIRKWLFVLGSKKEDEREKAKEELVKFGKDTAVSMNMKFNLFAKAKRLSAIEVLEKINSSRARKLLAKRAVFDKYRDVRKRAAIAVRAVGGRTARNYIITQALSQSEKTRRQAARAIVNIRDATYIDQLIPATRTYLATVAQGPLRIRGKLTTFDGATKRTDTRMVNALPGTGAIVPEQRNLSYKLPRVATLQVETTVVALALILHGGFEENMDNTERWWRQHRESFVWPDLDPE